MASDSTPLVDLPTLIKGTHLFPAGEYAAADPMLVLPPDAWNHIVFTLMGGKSAVSVAYRGHCVFVWTTRTGEGVYPLYEGKKFHANVETGNCLLCLAPVELLGLHNWDLEGGEIRGLDGVGFYTVPAAAPTTTGDGNAERGRFEVITDYPGLGPEGQEYETQPYEYVDDYECIANNDE